MACVGSIAQGYQNGRVALPERSDARRLTAELEASAAALRETQAANRKLAAELEVSMSELRESRARLMTATVQERRRIERDLHDGVQQTLVAARVRLELAREAFREDPVRSEELFERVGADLGD